VSQSKDKRIVAIENKKRISDVYIIAIIIIATRDLVVLYALCPGPERILVIIIIIIIMKYRRKDVGDDENSI